MLTHIALLVLAAFLLWFGADWIVESAAAVARKFGVSELAIGLTVVAFGTSAPEFVVTATAAFKNLPDISLANVAGSNVFNIGLILGLMAVIRPIPTSPAILRRDGLVLGLLTTLVAMMAGFNMMGRVQGGLLFASLIGYLYWLFHTGRGMIDGDDEQRIAGFWDYPKLLAGFVAVSLGGSMMVDSARFVAQAVGVSDWLIGMTVVAGGTSLPELVTCLAASVRGRNNMLLGNLIGSNVFNLAGVLGLTCLLRPIDVNPDAATSMWLLTAFTAAVLVLIRTHWRITRTEGWILLGLNALLWARNAMIG